MDALSLTELTQVLRETMQTLLAEFHPWVTAEIASVNVARQGARHCYMELVDTPEGSSSVSARMRANIWASQFVKIEQKMRAGGAGALAEGMRVMLKVEVNFHPLYGISLVVLDVNPVYTLGDFARRREMVVQQLEKEGLASLNAQCHLARPLTHVAVISSATAAGYGDFVKQIEQSGHPFCLRLFPALMQGERTSESVRAAIDEIIGECAEGAPWQAICILRGGGCVTDLAAFDDYALARAVCLAELPVFTAIGHERDLCALDHVAFRSLKTPTALAEALIEYRENELALIHELASRLQALTQLQLTRHRAELQRHEVQLQAAALRQIQGCRHILHTQQTRLASCLAAQVKLWRADLNHIALLLPRVAAERLSNARTSLTAAEKVVTVASPDHLLRLGYSITRDRQGHVLKNPSDAPIGERLTTILHGGEIHSVVCETASKP